MIRSASLSDAAAIAAIYAPYVTDTAISFEEIAPGADEIADRVAAILPRYPYLVAEREGGVVGYAYASAHGVRPAYRFSVEVTVYVDQGAKGCGIGRALYDGLLAELSARKMHRAYGVIALPNAASVKMHEAFGFERVATFREVGFKFGKWHDVGVWERDLTRS